MSKYTAAAIRAQKVIDAENMPDVQHIRINNDYSIEFLQSDLVYKPTRTFQAFHADKSKVKIIIGGFGSGKSTGNYADLLIRASQMPVCKDKIRRCRWVVFRNTQKQLKETAIDLWKTWAGELGKVDERKSVPLQFFHKYNDGFGVIHLEVWFLAIDSVDQLRDLKSLQMTNALLSEASELSEVVLQYAIARVGRYPAKVLLNQEDRNYNCYVIADTNPPLNEHWLPKNWEEDTEEITKHDVNDYRIMRKVHSYEMLDKSVQDMHVAIYHQPSALLSSGKKDNGKTNWVANPLAENIDNLEGGYGYYFAQIANGDEFVRIYACGEYGIIREGQVVYSNFNAQIHVKQHIDIDKRYNLLIGIDYGYDCPAFVIAQYVDGQLRVIKEFAGKSLYVEDLYTSFVKPWLLQNAADLAYESWDDPANTMHGRYRLKEAGFNSRPSLSNKLDDRIPCVAKILDRLHAGQPSFIVSREGCPRLCDAFIGKYVFKTVHSVGESRPLKQPDKSHPYSDLIDCVQYIVLNFSQNDNKEQKNKNLFINKEKW